MAAVKQESDSKFEKIKKTFEVDMASLQPKSEDSCLTTIFSKIDKHFIKRYHERKDMLRTYRDIPLSLDRLYKESDYIMSRHGHDLQICIDPQLTSKKRRR